MNHRYQRIIKSVLKLSDVDDFDLLMNSRKREYQVVKYRAFYILRNQFSATLKSIWDQFELNHATVSAWLKRYESMLHNEHEYKQYNKAKFYILEEYIYNQEAYV